MATQLLQHSRMSTSPDERAGKTLDMVVELLQHPTASPSMKLRHISWLIALQNDALHQEAIRAQGPTPPLVPPTAHHVDDPEQRVDDQEQQLPVADTDTHEQHLQVDNMQDWEQELPVADTDKHVDAKAEGADQQGPPPAMPPKPLKAGAQDVEFMWPGGPPMPPPAPKKRPRPPVDEYWNTKKAKSTYSATVPGPQGEALPSASSSSSCASPQVSEAVPSADGGTWDQP